MLSISNTDGHDLGPLMGVDGLLRGPARAGALTHAGWITQLIDVNRR